MGIYDEIYIDYPLPYPVYFNQDLKSLISYHTSINGFQTKSLQNLMSRYYISNNGLLYVDISSGFSSPEYKSIYYHGHISVYSLIFLDDELPRILASPNIWLEYDLKFTDSMLVAATLISPTKEEVDEFY